MKESEQASKGAAKQHPIIDARRASVPLLVYETADPAQTIKNITAALNSSIKDTPVLQHDVMRGLIGLNDLGQGLAKEIAPDGPITTVNMAECLAKIYDYATGSKQNSESMRKAIVYSLFTHKGWTDPVVMQGLWNLRDPFAGLGAMLIMLTTEATVPPELRQDVIKLSDPLPNPEEIGDIVKSLSVSAQKRGAQINPEEVANDGLIQDTLTGLSGFGVKQVFSMALRKEGIDKDVLSEHKRKLVEQTKGLSIWTGDESFDQLGGLENLKGFLRNLMTSGKTPVRAIGFIDEIEKAFGGAGTDTSGTTQDQLAVFLREMQDKNMPGIILLGPPGTGKSAIAKACGGLAGAPVISFDLGGAKDSLVGSSEARIRAMMSVFQAVSQGKGMFIATCNGIQALPPELRRRFKLGTFFVDLPDADERAVIWPLWIKRYKLADTSLKDAPNSEGWTGAEIAACCEIAYRTGVTLKEAAKFIVPVCKSASEQINSLRRAADGRYISASRAGIYEFKPQAGVAQSDERAMSF